MKNLQKMGGIAALIGAATNLFALVTLSNLTGPQRLRFRRPRPDRGFSCGQPGYHARMVP